ncbi:hypothetical protein CONPUDRAFT_146235 [Coniophora puteana RWD-64-598 SS2]|uniref:Condensation domain-containing protein n=1 Tax=Coniophora puteana (strain RWD-64-598) TaxID=741705 RepID=A0A5M3MD71_CONPW|nr:uncharacterized protein CONPUDRAFT_146235 [Coniophora puteana RWD-64-598 SS2]EIW77189.1 hypothetical protein CONPUDRAFT_146235 [Coniophora puteana RWD-64-598 SS2]
MNAPKGWATTSSDPDVRVWTRPLGLTEAGFYHDLLFNSTADSATHVHLRSIDPSAGLFSPANVLRAWTSVRRRFPLLCAHIEEQHPPHHPGSSDSTLGAREPQPHFVIREADIQEQAETTLSLGTVASFSDAEHFARAIFDGPAHLSPHALARMHVLWREDRPAGAEAHAILVFAHVITDSASTSTVLRVFFDTLASKEDFPHAPIEERLEMYRPLEETLRYPAGVSEAGRRWRRAIGWALHSVRRRGRTGGHTLPRKLTTHSSSTPARSRDLVYAFTRSESTQILASCRRARTTFNSACFVLGQLALTRVLARRFLSGAMTPAEWAWRAKEPMFIFGPLSLRSYLEFGGPGYEGGGEGEVGFNVSWYSHTMPHMPLGVLAGVETPRQYSGQLLGGAPPPEDLLSKERFFHRSALVGRGVEKLFAHPRFLDFSLACHKEAADVSRVEAEKWVRNGQQVKHDSETPKTIGFDDIQEGQTVLSLAGSSLGDMDVRIPRAYPLPSTHPLSPRSRKSHPVRAGYSTSPSPASERYSDAEPTLIVDWWLSILHARPLELYFGSVMRHGTIELLVFWDENVYEAGIIREWLDEIVLATRSYLCPETGAGDLDTQMMQSRL